MPKYLDICPKNNEVDVYSGCSYRCSYCIAKPRHERNVTSTPDVDTALANLSSGKSSNDPYYLSPWTDAYQHLEEKLGLTRRLVKALAERNHSFFVITKSLLVLRDREFFRDRDNAFVAISLNTLDGDITRRLEPGAPTPEERKEAISTLLASNVRTVVKVDPVLPGITDGSRMNAMVSWLRDIKPTAVTIETARLTQSLADDLRLGLSAKEHKRLLNFYPMLSDDAQHPDLCYRLDLFHSLAHLFRKAGVRASFCRASLPVPINEHDCRGGY